MDNYNVAKGDCLWNIAKNRYGDKLKNNADVMKAVNKIASANDMKSSDLIFSNQNLSLPAYKDIFGMVQEDDEATEYIDDDNLVDDSDTVLYDEMTEWQKDGYNRLMSGEKETPMFDFVKSDIPYTDAAFIEPWKQGVENMAKSNIAASDKDKNGSISYSEYINQELGAYNEFFPEEQIDFDKETGEIKNNEELNAAYKNNFAALDYDKSNEIEKAELSAFYATMDSIDSSSGCADGKIQLASVINTDVTSNAFQNNFLNALKIFNENQEEYAVI